MGKQKDSWMPVIIIFTCEVAFFSFLIGTFMGSVGLGLTILALGGLLIYGWLQTSYNFLPLMWGVSLLGGATAYLWGTLLDTWLSTDFIAVLLSLIFVGLIFIINGGLITIYEEQSKLKKKDH